MTLRDKMAGVRSLMNERLDAALAVPEGRDARVVEAMRYSAIGTGKALRPFLTITVGEMLGTPAATVVRIAMAIEMLHSYSLIHDDLPAMDNDTLRRGKPTNHIRFDEATAILAGDGLQAKAFEILADEATHPDGAVRARLVQELARAAGPAGMVGGQMLDLIGEKSPLTLEETERMQALKTGALLYFSCLAPAIAAGADESVRQALSRYAQAIGLLFQITDDILDVEGDQELVGKTLGKDSAAHKSTFVSLLGMDKARSLVQHLAKEADEALAMFGEKAECLKELVAYMVERKR